MLGDVLCKGYNAVVPFRRLFPALKTGNGAQVFGLLGTLAKGLKAVNSAASDTLLLAKQPLLGCPQWWLPEWKSVLNLSKPSSALYHYSQHFNTVEGNTTFYAVPAPATQQRWLESVGSSFRFCLKVPKSCTHSRSINTEDLTAFAAMIDRMQAKLGQVHLQLPPHVKWSDWSHVQRILRGLPEVALAVEVRHQDFFSKGDTERRFAEWLRERGANRVMFDSRGLFKEQSACPEVLQAQAKKPRLPLHVMATADQPMVRFIGFSDYERNLEYLTQWADKLVEWLSQGKQPYFFMHTPSNVLAPLFLMRFKGMLQQRGAEVDNAGQVSLATQDSLEEQASLF